MPNYYTNIVRAPKEVLNELYDNGKITFPKLIPMPKELDIIEVKRKKNNEFRNTNRVR